jgi:hypothetical protein
MIWHHRYSPAEVREATGLSADEVDAAVKRFDLPPERKPRRAADAALLVLPYPGGRHPRIGFLDGAVNPQRETKFSVFTPWDDASYVVADIPEALWSNLGLTYLAHAHVPTIWEKQGTALDRMEWIRKPAGVLEIRRKLPNGIAFEARVVPRRDAVRMELQLTNGTDGFAQQTNDNKLFAKPYVAVRNPDGNRWIITAWQPCDRAWGNAPCPCLHSDPKFPDCAPGKTERLQGWLSFYEGADIPGELARIEATGWQKERP